jgi:NADH-quinone oxidoreductase subunit L
MLLPLVVLAILSVIGGYVGVPEILGGHDRIVEFLNFGVPVTEGAEHGSAALEWILMASSVAAAGIGFLLAYVCYVAKPELPGRIASSASALYSILTNKYYVDEIYETILVWPMVATAREFLWQFVDVSVIDGAVNGVGQAVRGLAGGLRHMQTGYVRTYAGWLLFGGILIVAWFLR